jgi:hypothetical protein
MFNATYHRRARAQGLAASAKRVEQKAIPWREILKPWQPFCLVACAADAFYRPEKRVKPGVAAVRCKKPVQPEDKQMHFEFPPLAGLEIPLTEEELAEEFDRLFPPQ